MTQGSELVKASMNLPGLMQNAFDSIEAMKGIAEMFLESRAIPIHFYEKGQNDKPDYSKGKVPAVMAVLIRGYDLGVKPMTALQQIIPINNLLTIKGDLAKSLIFQSGVLEKGSWKEEEFGDVGQETFKVSISATRKDTGTTMTRSFSVAEAKRAGLWIDQAKINAQDGYKWKHSPWYKYPARMIYYRALGFLARDLFSDVLDGSYTFEEARDLPVEDITVLTTTDGAQITIPDKNFSQERSHRMTGKASTKIDKLNGGAAVTSSPLPAEEQQREVNGDDLGMTSIAFTEEELKKMSGPELMEIINQFPAMKEFVSLAPGKNTSKKLRTIILQYQNGGEDAFDASQIHDGDGDDRSEENVDPEGEMRFEAMPGHEEASEELNSKDGDAPTGAPEGSPAFNAAAIDNRIEEIKANRGKDKSSDFVLPATNKLNFIAPPLQIGGTRDFKAMSQVYMAFNEMKPPITDDRFMQLISGYEGFMRFESKEEFCRKATQEEINFVIERNLSGK